MNAEAKENTFERVIFIGAGFSAAMRYPVGNTLITRIVEYLQRDHRPAGIAEKDFNNSLSGNVLMRQRTEIVQATSDFLKTYFGTSPESIGDVGLAEFFTMAHSLAEMPSLFGLDVGEPYFDGLPEGCRIQPQHLFSVLACVTRTYFLDLCTSVDWPADIQDILDSVDSTRDAIINFNWDEEVDIYLSSYPEGEAAYTRAAWHPPTKDETRYLLLRPHGSVGWYDITYGIGNRGTYLIAEDDPDIPRSLKRLVAYPGIALPRDLARSKSFSKLGCPPVITPPTFAKSFQYKEQHRIWNDVIEVCSKAKEFVFLGYSLPPDDYLTRAAICRSLATPQAEPAKCLVVGLDPKTMENFSGMFGGNLDKRHFLPWKFGCGKAGLSKRIEAKLRKAVTASEKSA